jgi:ParB family chromosome partitioning protein
MTSEKPRRLGRGLEALLSARDASEKLPSLAGVQTIPISEIRANPFQPRQSFDPEEIANLEASIRSSGLLQPITVRPSSKGNGYEMIAGERRLRAVTGLGWTEIPAVVKEVDDRTLLTLALIENLQRADLDPIEEALGYQRLQNEFGLTQQQVADVIGKDRSTVANLLRLLHLPAPVQRLLQEGQLTTGHARALLSAGSEHQIVELAREIVARALTVRDVERRVRAVAPFPTAAPSPRPSPTANNSSSTEAHEARHIADSLRRHLQTDVQIALSAAGRGTIQVSFYSVDDLERLLDLMLGAQRDHHA